MNVRAPLIYRLRRVHKSDTKQNIHKRLQSITFTSEEVLLLYCFHSVLTTSPRSEEDIKLGILDRLEHLRCTANARSKEKAGFAYEIQLYVLIGAVSIDLPSNLVTSSSKEFWRRVDESAENRMGEC